VQDQQVDLLDAELAGALLEGVQRLVVSVIADPHLGLQEHVRTVHLGAVNRLTDLALVPVGRCGVDVPIPSIERGADGVSGLIRGRLEDTQAEGGHGDAVVQFQGRGHGGVRSSRSSRAGYGRFTVAPISET
jgi:hypothetical protein